MQGRGNCKRVRNHSSRLRFFADALKNLKNASRADDSVGPVDETMPVNAVARGYEADEENDDDEINI